MWTETGGVLCASYIFHDITLVQHALTCFEKWHAGCGLVGALHALLYVAPGEGNAGHSMHTQWEVVYTMLFFINSDN